MRDCMKGKYHISIIFHYFWLFLKNMFPLCVHYFIILEITDEISHISKLIQEVCF